MFLLTSQYERLIHPQSTPLGTGRHSRYNPTRCASGKTEINESSTGQTTPVPGPQIFP